MRRRSAYAVARPTARPSAMTSPGCDSSELLR